MAVNRIFGAIYQTGGASGSLDNISASLLKNNDLAVVKDDTLNAINFYRYDNISSDTPVYPTIIAPTDVGASGRWILISPRYFIENLEVDPTKGVITNVIVGNDTGLKLGYSQFGSVIGISLDDSGSGFTNGTYLNEPTSGGTGTGLTVDIVVSSGSISSINVNNGGNDYTIYDQVTFDNFIGSAIATITSLDNVSIDIQQTTITINNDTIFNKNVSFNELTGAPFTVNGNQILVNDLNAEYFNGQPITNVSLLNDNTNRYTQIPRVHDNSVYPNFDVDLVTVLYLNDVLNDGSLIDHGNISGLGDDDHTQYILGTGDRAGIGFTGTISGVDPVLDQHLSTKHYVDIEIASLGLGSGGDYLLRDGTLTATDVLSYDSSVTYAILDSSSSQSLSSTLFVTTKISEHQSQIDPHPQYLRNDGDDYTAGRITTNIHTSVVGGNLTSRAEIDDIIENVYTNISSSDTFTDVNGVIYVSNIVRKDYPKSDRLLYLTSTIEQNPENLVTYGYIDARLCNLLQSSNTIPIGKVLEVEIQNAGSGYSVGNNISILDGSGISLTININSVSAGSLTGVSVSSSGTGYVKGESVTVPGGTGGTLILREVTVGASHSDLYDLDSDDHLQYMNLDCSRPLDNTINYPSVVDGYIYPTAPNHLITKAYFDDSFSTSNVILSDGSVSLDGNQQYNPIYPHYIFKSGRGNELVNKDYVDEYLGLVLVSEDDSSIRFLNESFTENGLTYTSPSGNIINDGSDSGIILKSVYIYPNEISLFDIDNGGSGFINIDISDPAYPQSRGTGTTTNFPVFDSAGTSTTITETSFDINDSGNTTVDLRISKVLGDIDYIEIQNGGSGYSVNDTISIYGDGRGTIWVVSAIDGSGGITAVSKSAIASKYYTISSVSINSTGTGAILVPYIVGSIVDVSIIDEGFGYTSHEYIYDNTLPQNDGFVWSGHGTTSGDADDSNISLTFINPRDDKIDITHYNKDILSGNVGASPFVIDDGDHITSLSFDSFGHIIDLATGEIDIDGGSY